MHDFNLIAWLFKKAGLGQYVDEWLVSVLSSFVVVVIIAIISIYVWRGLRKTEASLIPSSRFSIQNIAEIFIEKLLGIMESIMGDKAERFLPLIGTLFIYILFCNLLGFIPGFMSPTTVISTNFACALVVFVYYNYVGIKDLGFVRYFKHFLGPVIWLAPLFFFIEIVSHLVRPISLSIRLYGNMVGDHMVLGIFSDLVPFVVPVIFIIIGVFVAFIQAFVFSILSTVYIALATKH